VTEPRERTLDAASIVEWPTTPTTDLNIPKHPSVERLSIQQQSVQQF
jgi:hypothetical protein